MCVNMFPHHCYYCKWVWNKAGVESVSRETKKISEWIQNFTLLVRISWWNSPFFPEIRFPSSNCSSFDLLIKSKGPKRLPVFHHFSFEHIIRNSKLSYLFVPWFLETYTKMKMFLPAFFFLSKLDTNFLFNFHPNSQKHVQNIQLQFWGGGGRRIPTQPVPYSRALSNRVEITACDCSHLVCVRLWHGCDRRWQPALRLERQKKKKNGGRKLSG